MSRIKGRDGCRWRHPARVPTPPGPGQGRGQAAKMHPLTRERAPWNPPSTTGFQGLAAMHTTDRQRLRELIVRLPCWGERQSRDAMYAGLTWDLTSRDPEPVPPTPEGRGRATARAGPGGTHRPRDTRPTRRPTRVGGGRCRGVARPRATGRRTHAGRAANALGRRALSRAAVPGVLAGPALFRSPGRDQGPAAQPGRPRGLAHVPGRRTARVRHVVPGPGRGGGAARGGRAAAPAPGRALAGQQHGPGRTRGAIPSWP